MWVFSRKENGFCLNLWGKEGFGELDEKVYKLLEKKTRNYRGFKDTTEAMEKA